MYLEDGVILKERDIRTDCLKIIAIITMFVDHVGAALFPQYIILRIIGRLSFPIFAYQITVGYTYTSNLKGYMKRLFIFALLSQGPYWMLFQHGLNIFFTLLIGLICIYAIDYKRYLILTLLLLIPIFLPLDYGYYGILTIVIFYVFREKSSYCYLGHITINLIYFYNHSYSIQIFSLLALLFIYHPWDFSIRLNKYFYYCFYPAHIIAIYCLKIWF